jgi:hypothetical protein
LTLALSITSFAHALPPQWDKIALKYHVFNTKSGKESDDTIILEPKGVELSFSSVFSRYGIVQASYQRYSAPFLSFDFVAVVGFGLRYPLHDTGDIYGIASYEYIDLTMEFEGEKESDFDDAYGFRLGYYVRPFLQYEFDLYAKYLKSDDENLIRGLTMSYYFKTNWQLSVDYAETDEQRQYGLGFTYVF